MPPRWTEDAQETMSLFQISNKRTGTRIFFQRVHKQREAAATVADAQSHRPTSQDLVSEPAHEGEEAEQRQVTVLHVQSSALGGSRKKEGEAHCSGSPSPPVGLHRVRPQTH